MGVFKKIKNRLFAECRYARMSLLTHVLYNGRPSFGKMGDTPKEKAGFCDLAVVAFNNSEVLKYQIRSLRKFFVYPFRYTVFDNSTNPERAKEIKNVCQKENVGYVRLPRQEFLPKGSGSYSHGIAINYLFNKYIKGGGATYFGLLDHDIFLIKEFDISKVLNEQFFYGAVHHNFYVWPGLWFMSMSYIIEHGGVDFRPSLHLRGDTGACNYYTLFKGINMGNFRSVSDIRYTLDDTDDDIFRNGYSIMGDCWLHCWNASDYMGKGVDNKMKKIFVMLDCKLSQ